MIGAKDWTHLSDKRYFARRSSVEVARLAENQKDPGRYRRAAPIVREGAMVKQDHARTASSKSGCDSPWLPQDSGPSPNKEGTRFAIGRRRGRTAWVHQRFGAVAQQESSRLARGRCRCDSGRSPPSRRSEWDRNLPVKQGPSGDRRFDSSRRDQASRCQALCIGTEGCPLKQHAAGPTPALATQRKHSRP